MKIESFVMGEIGTNVYVVTDDNGIDSVVIDPEEYDSRFCRGVVKYILLTHCHFDHVLGAKKLKEKTGARIVICEPDDKGLQDMDLNGTNFFYMFSGGQFPEADIVVKEGDKLVCGSMVFSVMRTPGHTPGSCCYRCGGALFSGDTMFRMDHGRTDMPGGSPKEMKASLERLCAIGENLTVYPGHGPATTINAEKEYYQH